MCLRDGVSVVPEVRAVLSSIRARIERTSWSFDCYNSRANLDLDVLWYVQRLI